MSDKPILFSGPMVRAILDGKKSQTRRVIKPQLGPQAQWMRWEGLCWVANGLIGDIPKEWRSKILYPEFQPGDRLWVRETWSYFEDAELFDCIRYKADGERRKPKFDEFPDVSENVWYQFEMLCDGYGCADHKWRSPVCMPRWASRLTLEVTGVRVERLQEISYRGALAEGVEYDVSKPDGAPVPRFKKLWDSINKQTHPWESNPWVWVYEFRRVET